MNVARRAAVPFLVLYLTIAVALFLLMRDHAFHPTDDGFILAYSWRVAQGEIPYRDFIFERAPLTLYLHIGWLALPEGWQIQAGRLAFYLELAAAAFFVTLWANARGLRANLAALVVTGGTLLIAFHNFPPMPWPTVDGVFFAGAGIASFLAWRDGRSTRWLAVAAAALALATLAKQSFAPLLALACAYAVIAAMRRRDARVGFAAIAPPALIGSGFLIALAATGALAPFLYQIAQPTQMRPTATNPWTGDVVAIGVVPYLVALTPGLVVLLAIVGVSFLGRDQRRVGMFTVLAAMVVLVWAAVLMPTNSFRSGFIVFYAAALIAVADAIRLRRGQPTASPIIAYALVLLAAWCTSLSFAYQTPILAGGLLGPLIALGLPQRPTRFDGALAAGTLLTVALFSAAVNVFFPYRDEPRDAQTADLADVYPRLGHLYTNPTNVARHRELRDLTQRFALDRGRSFVVFAAFPLAHYLADSRSPVSVDWLEPQEYLGNDDRLRKELDASRPVIFIQRQISETVGVGASPSSCAEAAAAAPAFASDVLARAMLASEGTYFCVYVP